MHLVTMQKRDRIVPAVVLANEVLDLVSASTALPQRRQVPHSLRCFLEQGQSGIDLIKGLVNDATGAAQINCARPARSYHALR